MELKGRKLMEIMDQCETVNYEDRDKDKKKKENSVSPRGGTSPRDIEQI